MSIELSSNPPRSFYVISGFALVWNLLGVGAYISQVTMTPEALAAIPEAQRAIIEGRPEWATAAFAIAVNGGALGCVLLLLRKALATPVLIASFVGVLVQMYQSVFMANSIEVYGPVGMIMPVSVLIIGAYLIWLSMDAKKKGFVS